MRIGIWHISFLVASIIGAASWAQEGGGKKDVAPKFLLNR